MYRRPVIRHVARTVAFATALTAVVAGVSSTQPVEADGGLPAGTLSQYVGFDNGTRFKDMERALGRPLDRVVTMTANSTPSAMRSSVWGQFAKSSAYLPALSDRLDVTVTIPLAFGEKAPYQKYGPQAVLKGLQKTVSGAYDDDYRTVAKTLIAAGYSDAVLRLGHEFDGTWVQWSARDNEQGYIAAFRHVRDVFEQESSKFRYEWTGMNAPWRFHARGAYPGDAYIDIIGLDIYYRSQGEIPDKVWNRYEATLTAHRDFAIERGKPVSYPEWGRGYDDTDRFVDLMHGWFSDLPDSGPGSLAYQSYFNEQDRSANYDLDKLPTVKRRYIQLFRTTSSTGTTSAPKLDAPAQPEAPASPSTTTVVQPSAPAGEDRNTGSSPSIAVVVGDSSVEVVWFNAPSEGRRNLRYRVEGTTSWNWVRWNRPITGLSSGTTYEVQARVHADGKWQPWMKASATAN